MENIKSGMFFISADGDGIGKLVGRSILANDVDELHKVSNRIDAAQDFILHWCKNVDGVKISGGGDEFTAAIPQKALNNLEELRKSVEKSFGYTISVGVGKSLSEAGTALLVAKLRGKDRIVYFDKKIKEDIKKAKRRVREHRASQEEYKLAEAYLSKAENMLCNLHKSIDSPNSSGQGHDPSHSSNPHHKSLTGAGFSYSHSTPVTHLNGEKVIHHTYEKGGRKIGVHQKDGSWKWSGKTSSASGHSHSGQGGEGLSKYLKNMRKSEDLFKAEDDHYQDESEGDDCPMCQEMDAQKNADSGDGTHDCPACDDYDEKNGTGHGDDCPYCEEMSGEQASPEEGSEQSAEDHQCNCPNCPKGDQSDPSAENAEAGGPDDCAECQQMYGDAVENQPGQTGQGDPDLQGHETAEEVLDLLDQKPGSGEQTPAQEAQKIDNTELPQGDEMKGNASVTEDFGDAQRNNVSDSEASIGQDSSCDCPNCPVGGDHSQSEVAPPEAAVDPAAGDGSQDEPDMSGVLQSGLDDHADEQKKQQVLDMVGQTLAGFKANKASLEATKEQNQPLYNSCIQMLKSMIALCDLLGLKPKAVAPEQASPEQAAPQGGSPGGPPAQAQGAPSEEPSDPKAVG